MAVRVYVQSPENVIVCVPPVVTAVETALIRLGVLQGTTVNKWAAAAGAAARNAITAQSGKQKAEAARMKRRNIGTSELLRAASAKHVFP
jgi:hypothetical protein